MTEFTVEQAASICESQTWCESPPTPRSEVSSNWRSRRGGHTGLEVQQLLNLIDLAAETILDDHASCNSLGLLRTDLQERSEFLITDQTIECRKLCTSKVMLL